MELRSEANSTLRVTALLEFMVDSKNLQARRSQKSIRPMINYSTWNKLKMILQFTYASSYREDVPFEGNATDATPRVPGRDFSHRLQFYISSNFHSSTSSRDTVRECVNESNSGQRCHLQGS